MIGGVPSWQELWGVCAHLTTASNTIVLCIAALAVAVPLMIHHAAFAITATALHLGAEHKEPGPLYTAGP